MHRLYFGVKTDKSGFNFKKLLTKSLIDEKENNFYFLLKVVGSRQK